MSRVLAETSAWVEWLRGTGSPVDRRLRLLLDKRPADVAVTDPVAMEVVAGARGSDQAADLRRLLRAQHWLGVDIAADYDGAADVYRSCRQRGVMPRGLLDCLIAAVAIRNDVPLLARDGDFAAIAGVSDQRLDAP